MVHLMASKTFLKCKYFTLFNLLNSIYSLQITNIYTKKNTVLRITFEIPVLFLDHKPG